MVDAPNRIFELRAAQGMSLDVLHERSGVARNSINLMEQGKQELTLEKMRLLSKALGVAPTALLNDADVEFRPSPETQPLLDILKGLPKEMMADMTRAAASVVGLARNLAARTSAANLEGDQDLVAEMADLWNSMDDAERRRTMKMLSAGGFGDAERRYTASTR